MAWSMTLKPEQQLCHIRDLYEEVLLRDEKAGRPPWESEVQYEVDVLMGLLPRRRAEWERRAGLVDEDGFHCYLISQVQEEAARLRADLEGRPAWESDIQDMQCHVCVRLSSLQRLRAERRGLRWQ